MDKCLTKIFLTLALAFLFFFFLHEPVYAVNAPSHLKYFGYYAVKCRGRTNEDISSLAALNNSNVMFLFDVKKECLELARQANIKVLAWPGQYVYDIRYPQYPRRGLTRLKSNWQEGWERFKNDIRGYEDIIYAFYFEEPWWYGINQGELEAVTNKMKEDYPDIKRFAIESAVSFNADPLDIFKVYKRYYQTLTDVGVDVYGNDFDDFSDWNLSMYSRYFNELYVQLTSENQNIWVVPQAFSTNNNPNFTRLTQIFNSYYSIASSRPRVIGILSFLYSPSPCCGHSVKEFTDQTSPVYNEQYKNFHLDIGRAILRNNPFPPPTPTPTRVPTNTPVPTATPTGPVATATPGGGPTPTPTGISCPFKAQGDADCDGKVNRLDLSYWLNQNANNQTVDPARSADFDGDGDVDRADLSRWINGFANPVIPH